MAKSIPSTKHKGQNLQKCDSRQIDWFNCAGTRGMYYAGREDGVFRPGAGSPVEWLLLMNLGVIKPHDYAGNDKGNSDKNQHQRLFVSVFHILFSLKCFATSRKKPSKQLQQRGMCPNNHKSHMDYKTACEKVHKILMGFSRKSNTCTRGIAGINHLIYQ
ncbi:MAG TPA: hypothetical protein VIU46_10940 [Gallionellaceae bacterium]